MSWPNSIQDTSFILLKSVVFSSLAYEIITNNELLWLGKGKNPALNPSSISTLCLSTTGTSWRKQNWPKKVFIDHSFSFHPPFPTWTREDWCFGLALWLNGIFLLTLGNHRSILVLYDKALFSQCYIYLVRGCSITERQQAKAVQT